MEKIGMYIHIPFCARKCRYCDFLSFAANNGIKKKYIHALCQEIEASEYKDRYVVDTIFFGGGTPSLISGELFEQIISVIFRNYVTSPNLEITIECNPGTVTEDKLKTYVASGVNRISFGMQSANDEELRVLGRIHTYEQFEEAYYMARYAGIKNINVDIMSALPNQTMESYENTLNKMLKLKPEHISAYSLIIEENTPFFEDYKQGKLNLPDEDSEREMYYITEKLLASEGYGRYEISNYSKENYECRHNIKYWTLDEYIGFGLGAASYLKNGDFGSRRHNTNNLREYISGGNSANEEKLTKRDSMSEFVFLGLRMTSGISPIVFMEKYGEDIYSVFSKEINKHISNGLLVATKDKICLTKRGIDLSNYVFSDFV